MAGGNVCYDKKLSSTSVEALMKWNMTVAPSENLLGTMWKLDSNGNGCYQNETNMEYLKILYSIFFVYMYIYLSLNVPQRQERRRPSTLMLWDKKNSVHIK